MRRRARVRGRSNRGNARKGALPSTSRGGAAARTGMFVRPIRDRHRQCAGSAPCVPCAVATMGGWVRTNDGTRVRTILGRSRRKKNRQCTVRRRKINPQRVARIYFPAGNAPRIAGFRASFSAAFSAPAGAACRRAGCAAQCSSGAPPTGRRRCERRACPRRSARPPSHA